MPVYQLPNGNWRAQIRRKGLPAFDKVFESQADAQHAHDQQLALPKQGFVPVELLLSELWTRYAGSMEYRQKTQHTQRTEAVRIKPVLQRLGAYALKHLEASPFLIYDYMDQRSATTSKRTGKVYSPTSIRLEIAALSAVCIWARNRRMIETNFVRFIKRPGQAQRKRRFGAIEAAAIADSTEHSNPMVAQAARFVRLLRLLGCRPGELAGLRCEDIDLDGASVTFRETKFQREDRKVHVTERAASTIAEQIVHLNESAPRAPFLFPTPRRNASAAKVSDRWGPFNYSWCIKLLRRHGVVGAGFHAHAARREFVSRAIEDGVEYATIRKQTGHHSNAAIEIYDQGLATAPEVRDALDRHARTVADDELVGLMLRMGLKAEDAAMIMRKAKGKSGMPKVVYPRPLVLGDEGDED